MHCLPFDPSSDALVHCVSTVCDASRGSPCAPCLEWGLPHRLQVAVAGHSAAHPGEEDPYTRQRPRSGLSLFVVSHLDGVDLSRVTCLHLYGAIRVSAAMRCVSAAHDLGIRAIASA